jgi:hypothetical protein
MSQTYAEKLKDPRWQRRRLEVMERDQFTCQECGSATKTLTVHHRHYVYGCEPWEYEDDVLVTLCEGCHDEIEEALKALRRQLGWLTLTELTWAFQSVNAMLDRHEALPLPTADRIEIMAKLKTEKDHEAAIALLKALTRKEA